MRRRRRPPALLAGLAAAALLAGSSLAAAPAARADYTPFELVSGSPMLESDFATDAAISADGRYVVFVGSYDGAGGIYRRDLVSGALTLVAPGDSTGAEAGDTAPTIGAPSVSANGQYVAFTSQTDPTAATASAPRQCSTVYVANLADPTHPAYTVVSAPNGSSDPLTYAGEPAPAGTNTVTSETCPGGGSATAARASISGDGSEVVFTVVGDSDLVSGAPGTDTTPGGQVAVRNLLDDSTTLVTQTTASLGGAPQPVPGGGAMTQDGNGDPTPNANSPVDDSTASVSADGTTVAWLGIEIPSQAPAAVSDAPGGDSSDQNTNPRDYDEPLWRRIADGPDAPTRRVTGGDDPGCGCQGPLNTDYLQSGAASSSDVGPERGTIVDPDGFGSATQHFIEVEDGVPELSADGQEVAFLSTQPSTGQVPACASASGCGSAEDLNAFVADMAPGLTRAQALTRLTQWGGNDFADVPTDSGIEAISISPGGTEVAFVTERVDFPQSPPSLITQQLTSTSARQLYVADLSDGLMQLVSTGYDDQPANGDVSSVDFSGGNGPLVVSSTASNLVFGGFSINTGGYPGTDDEAFTTTAVQPPTTPGVNAISPLPGLAASPASWIVGASVRSLRDGDLAATVSVPGAGRLSAVARAGVPVGHLDRPGPRGRVIHLTVARTRSNPATAGVVRLTLAPSAHLRRVIVAGHGLYATLTVRFRAAGHATLTRTLPADFRPPRHPRPSSRHRKAVVRS